MPWMRVILNLPFAWIEEKPKASDTLKLPRFHRIVTEKPGMPCFELSQALTAGKVQTLRFCPRNFKRSGRPFQIEFLLRKIISEKRNFLHKKGMGDLGFLPSQSKKERQGQKLGNLEKQGSLGSQSGLGGFCPIGLPTQVGWLVP